MKQGEDEALPNDDDEIDVRNKVGFKCSIDHFPTCHYGTEELNIEAQVRTLMN